MPYSSTECKKEIKEWFESRDDIQIILDVGCGAGTYPNLLGRQKYWWIGIEIWAPYVYEFGLKAIYNELYIGDFFDHYDHPADCLILGDVLEHMTKEDAARAIAIADKHFEHVVISTPVDYPQEATENPWEEHKSVWSMPEIDAMVPPSFGIRGISWNIALFIK